MKRETYLDFLEFLDETGQIASPAAGPFPSNLLVLAARARYTKGGGFMVNRLNKAFDSIVYIFASDNAQGILASTSEEAFDNAGQAVGNMVFEASEIDYCIGQLAKRNLTSGNNGERIVNLVALAHTISHAWGTTQYFCKQPYSEHAALNVRFRMMGSKYTTEQAQMVIDSTLQDAVAQEPLRLLKPKYTK